MRPLLRWALLLAGLAAAAGLVAYMVVYGPDGAVRRPAGDAAPRQTAVPAPPGGAPGTMRIGWTAWEDAEAVTRIAARLLERELGLDVELVMADIGIQYEAVSRGDLDAMLMAWLPTTHREYWRRVRGQVVNLGPLYTGRLGWVVPAYVPEEALSEIGDLRDQEIARRVGFRVQGIDPGSGLMQVSEQALRIYDLKDMTLTPASAAAMTAVLDRAIRRQEWIVVTGWQPHWMFARYDLRFLDDPAGALGGHERINAVVREGFQSEFGVDAVAFLSRLYFPEDELARILLRAQEVGVERAADDYLRSHPERVRYWLTGRIDGE